MINLYLLIIIVSFLINAILLSTFATLRLSSKIIVSIVITGLISYIFFKNKDKLDLIENYFVTIIFIILLIYLIYNIIETIYINGINNIKSHLTILFMIVGVFILINLYMYNNSFQIINK